MRVEAAWKRRYRAPRIGFPTWSRDDPEHLVYLSNASGRFEVYAWDRRTGTHRQVTDRPEGTGYRVPSRLDPSGKSVWWFDDEKGNELGRWMRQPFEGDGPPEPAAPSLQAAYSGGLGFGAGAVLIGSSTDAGTTVHAIRAERE